MDILDKEKMENNLKIGRLLTKHNIFYNASWKVGSASPRTSCKKDLLQGPDVYSMYDKVYIGQLAQSQRNTSFIQ